MAKALGNDSLQSGPLGLESRRGWDMLCRLMTAKQRAAEAAVSFVASGMTIGLGTGSTAECFLQALADALQAGRLRQVRGIPTSRQSQRRAIELGIPLVSLDQYPRPDVTIDGADEIDPELNLIKGLGGALLREKIVAQNSRQLIIIADATKVVGKLGTKVPLPVEVAGFGHETHEAFLRGLGAAPVLRRSADGQVFETDNGNRIYDCRFAQGIDDPATLDRLLGQRAGIVESGLFLGMATRALVADEREVKEMTK